MPEEIQLYNTILASHTVGIYVASGYTARLEGTLWYGNGQDMAGDGTIITGTVNVYGDPVFVDPEAGDYHVGPGSAAIDQGVDVGVIVDIDGDPRPLGFGFDIGADEYTGPLGPVDRVEVLPAAATLVLRDTQQFVAIGYDADDNEVPITPAWSVADPHAGVIDTAGMFTASNIAGYYPAAVVAAADSITGTADITVTLGSPPSMGTFEPDGGSGRIREWADFTTTFSDPDGYDNIQIALFFLDREPPIASGGLAAAYYQPQALLFLLGAGSCHPGEAQFLMTDRVILDCRDTSVSGIGDILTINWAVGPFRCFAGGCGENIAYEFVVDSTGQTAFGMVGTWTLDPASESAQNTRAATKPTKADLERLRKEMESWQSQFADWHPEDRHSANRLPSG